MRYIYSTQEGKVLPYDEYVQKYGSPQRNKPSKLTIINRSFDAYESPATGEIITSHAKRNEDLARSGCVEYDPEVKTDYHNNVKAGDEAIDKMVDETVEREFSTMSSDQKENLAKEMSTTELEYTRE